MCWLLKSLHGKYPSCFASRKILTFRAQIIHYNLPSQYLFNFGQISWFSFNTKRMNLNFFFHFNITYIVKTAMVFLIEVR